jgi:hypothetical protein
MQENLLAWLQYDDLCKSWNGGNLTDDLGSRRNSGLRQTSHQVEAADSMSIESNGAGMKSPAPSPVARTYRQVHQGRDESLRKGNLSTQKRIGKVASSLADGRAKRKRAGTASDKSRRRQGRLVGLRR